jgi:drug/metabolite transporter (DMT)-like permease
VRAKTKAISTLAWVSIIWGTTWLASKQGVKYIPALQMAGMRQFIAGVCYITFFLLKKVPLPRGTEWRSILLLSFLNFMLSNGLSTWGIKYISSGLGSIIAAIFPLWIVIIEMVRGRKLPRLAVTGLLMGFAGVCLIFYEHLADLLNPQFLFGICLSVSATISWAFGTLYIKEHAQNYNPYVSLGYQMFISGVSLLLISHITGNVTPYAAIPSMTWWSIGYLVVLGSILTFIAYIYSLQHLPTSLASVYAYINPIVAVILGAMILNEKITTFIVLGGIITVAGVYLVNSSLKTPVMEEQTI